MRGVAGREIANEFFLKPVNSSRGEQVSQIPGAATWPAERLKKFFRDSGKLPTTESFLESAITENISRIYASDVELYERINR